MQFKAAAIAARQLNRAIGDLDSGGQNFIFAALRDDPNWPNGLEIDTVGAAFGGNPPQFGRQIGIGRDPERYLAAPFGKDLRGAGTAAIVDARAGSSERYVVIQRVFDLHIRDNLRAVIQNNVSVDDPAPDC